MCIQLLSTSAMLLCALDQSNYVMECDAKIALYSFTTCASSNSWRPQFVGTDGRRATRTIHCSSAGDEAGVLTGNSLAISVLRSFAVQPADGVDVQS